MRLRSVVIWLLIAMGDISSLVAQDLHFEGRVAADALKRNNLDQAMVICWKLIDRNPQDVAARYGLALFL